MRPWRTKRNPGRSWSWPEGVRRRVLAGLAAKGPSLLGVKAAIAESFERIHRSNLVGMGVLPSFSRTARAGRTSPGRFGDIHDHRRRNSHAPQDAPGQSRETGRP